MYASRKVDKHEADLAKKEAHALSVRAMAQIIFKSKSTAKHGAVLSLCRDNCVLL